MEDYIKFYLNDEKDLNAKIHKKGKSRIIKSKKNIKKLLQIAYKYGYIIDSENIIIENAANIRKEFDAYMDNKTNKLKIYGEITNDMKITHKNISLNKKILIGTLTLALAITTIHNINANTDTINNNKTAYSEEKDIEEGTIIYEDSTVKVKEQKKEKKHKVKHELNSMFEEESFHFSYEDRTNNESINNAKKYEHTFEKYAKKYGLDKNLLMALAAQESSGDHYNNIGTGPAEGIMQIEKAVHIGSTISAYNFDTKEIENFKVTENNLQDLETNIKVGAMILRDYIEKNNYNLPLSLQTYNFGPGNMSKVLSTCSELENVNIDEMINTPTNNDWLNYRNFLNIGDPEYVEHVFSFLPNNHKLTVLDRNNNEISITISNDYKNIKQI